MNLVRQLIDRVAKERKRIIVIGDAVIDRWSHGTVHECQDGCPKFVEAERYTTPGGAHNARNCLEHWGIYTEAYANAGVERPVKWRFLDGTSKIRFRWDEEVPQHAIAPPKYAWSRDAALEMVPFCGGVLLSDYDKGYLSPEFIKQVIDACAKHNVPCVADAKREPKLYAGAIIKGNADYWSRHAAPPGQIVITYGHKPPETLCSDPIDYLPPVPCKNHVGAGDCFAAHLTLAIAYGFTLADAATIAHSAGRVYVQHAHNRAPKPDEIEADLLLAKE